MKSTLGISIADDNVVLSEKEIFSQKNRRFKETQILAEPSRFFSVSKISANLRENK